MWEELQRLHQLIRLESSHVHTHRACFSLCCHEASVWLGTSEQDVRQAEGTLPVFTSSSSLLLYTPAPERNVTAFFSCSSTSRHALFMSSKGWIFNVEGIPCSGNSRRRLRAPCVCEGAANVFNLLSRVCVWGCVCGVGRENIPNFLCVCGLWWDQPSLRSVNPPRNVLFPSECAFPHAPPTFSLGNGDWCVASDLGNGRQETLNFPSLGCRVHFVSSNLHSHWFRHIKSPHDVRTDFQPSGS